MLTPEGLSGAKTDKVMLLAMWANVLKNETINSLNKPVIFAGMGKPTYPISVNTVKMYCEYWTGIERLLANQQFSTEFEKHPAVIDYGEPGGDLGARQLMAQAMTQWYGREITSSHILFSVGGAGALRVVFETFNELYKNTPSYRVLTPFPHYTLYSDNQHQLYPIDVMSEPGYVLTAKALESSIKAAIELAQIDGNYPRVLLLSNPNNPLGTVIAKEEMLKIAQVLRAYPDIHVVMDEAYAEIYWGDRRVPSLLTLAPDLARRLIILRSATKALSAAGERMAMLMTFDPELMSRLRDKTISIFGHAPRSGQWAYAYTMFHYTDDERQQLSRFYKNKVDLVCDRLRVMGAYMPDVEYTVDGAFYVMADFSELLGLELPKDAARALGRCTRVQTNEELAYYLLFKESLMLAPASYFGLPEKNGFLRITCSGSKEELYDMLLRLESCLHQVREMKLQNLKKEINQNLQSLARHNPTAYANLTLAFQNLSAKRVDGLEFRIKIQQLEKLSSELRVQIKRSTPEGRDTAARTIYRFLSRASIQRKADRFVENLDQEWVSFVQTIAKEGILKTYLLGLSEQERLNFKPWVDHLREMEENRMMIP